MPRRLKNNGTPQAVDDILELENSVGGTCEAVVLGSVEDLLLNDRGGKAKRFIGLVDADEAGSVSITDDDGEPVGTVKIDDSGSILFEASKAFEPTTLSFDYAIRLGKGVVSNASAEFTIEAKSTFKEVVVDFEDVEGFPLEGCHREQFTEYKEDGIIGRNYDQFSNPRELFFVNNCPVTYDESDNSPIVRQGDKYGWVNTVSTIFTSEDEGEEFDFISGYFGSMNTVNNFYPEISLTGKKDGEIKYPKQTFECDETFFLEVGWTDIDELIVENPTSFVMMIFDDLTFAVEC